MIVGDTNLLVYLFLPGEHTEVAERVFRTDSHWLVPLLWRSEFGSVLARYLREDVLTLAEAVQTFEVAAMAVREREYLVDSARVLELVRRFSCSAYDCEFVALAEEHRVPLVTSDSRVLRGFPDRGGARVIPALNSLGKLVNDSTHIVRQVFVRGVQASGEADTLLLNTWDSMIKK